LHKINQILHKIEQITIAKNIDISVLSVFFFRYRFSFFFKYRNSLGGDDDDDDDDDGGWWW
jgi:hypothetical protein